MMNMLKSTRGNGKTEAWYVMEAEEGSYIILGTSGCSENEFKQSLKDGNVEDCMNKISKRRCLLS